MDVMQFVLVFSSYPFIIFIFILISSLCSRMQKACRQRRKVPGARLDMHSPCGGDWGKEVQIVFSALLL